MATLPKVKSKETEMISPINQKIMSFKKLTAKNIFFNKQELIITNPIDPTRISKEPTNCLTKSSLVKAGLVFLVTVGGYYLAKTTNILSYFGWREKNQNLKDVGNSEIVKVKNKENALTGKRNLKATVQASNPSIDIIQMHKDLDRTVKFKEIKVEEFKNFQKVKKESVKNRRSSSRRSINIKNPIPDQRIVVGKPFNLTINGTSVFNSTGSLFLEAANIPTWLISSNPDPMFKGSYNIPSAAYEITISGNYAYVRGKAGRLQIIDVTDPGNPTFKSSYEIHSELGCPNSRTIVSGNYAYLGAGEPGLRIIDISDPSNPTFKGSYNTTSDAGKIALSGNYAYVPVGELGLQIIDISDPTNPTFKGSCKTPGSAYEVAVSGNYAYVIVYNITNEKFNLLIVDISDPSNPGWRGLYETLNDQFQELTISGNYAYVITATSGLQIIDISDPSNPTLKSSYYMYVTYGITLSGNYAYVVGRFGLFTMDISDPSNPTIIESCYFPDFLGLKIAASRNYAYMVNWYSGLQIIAPNLDKLTLSGMPSSVGTHSVYIKACNEAKECAIDNFEIIVRNSSPKTLTATLIIIGSIMALI
jgi:hypothetical protein